MQRLFLWIVSLLRPWHDNGLSDDLQFVEIEGEFFVRGAMLRAAKLSVAVDIAFGIFDMIGKEFAQRAARAWRPTELLLMEDVSLAYNGIWTRLAKCLPVPSLHVQRTVETLV